MSVLVFEGMKLGVLENDFTITVDEDGGLSSKLVLSTSYNVIPLWLRLAQENCSEAKAKHEEITTDWPNDEEGQKLLLLSELRSSMLAIVACAISIDALYELVKRFAKLDEATLKGWQKGKKSRSHQIVEVFRRVFSLDKHEAKRCKKVVKDILDLRDRAVHPSHRLERSVQRTDIDLGVDWRFAAYRYSNCEIALNNTLNMFSEFFSRIENESPVRQEIDPLVKAFRKNQILGKWG